MLSRNALQLILDFEVGGGRKYYDKFLSTPTWPGYGSGCTFGIGWDAGYHTEAQLRREWSKLPSEDLNELAKVIGLRGQKARRAVPRLSGIIIPWDIAYEVFVTYTLPRWEQITRRVFPGVEHLPEEAYGALVSLIYNRGPQMTGPRRQEMRRIRDLIPLFDIRGIAWQIRNMIPLWHGTDIAKGMERRRMAEAALVESCA